MRRDHVGSTAKCPAQIPVSYELTGLHLLWGISTKEQNEDRQRIAMQEWGIAPEQIFMDKQSGKDFDRPQDRRLVRRRKHGGTIVVKRMSRLVRNCEGILWHWCLITKEKHVDLVVLCIDAAKARGVRFGRERMPVSEKFPKYCDLWKAKKSPPRAAARQMGVNPTTFARWLAEKRAGSAEIEPAGMKFRIQNRKSDFEARLFYHFALE